MPRLTGRYAMLDQLLAEGVKYVFGNPGTTEQAFMDALQEYPQIEYILSLHEGAATGVADAYARASGRPAFLQLHIMPGLGNAMGMLYNSYRTGTPLVVYAGQHPQRGASQEPILAGDLVRLAEPVTKWAAQAEDAAEIPVLMRRAFKSVQESPRGPVFISVPANVMDEEAEMDIFPSNHPDTRSRPSPEAIEKVARILAEAKSPVIVAGDGVSISGGQAELVKLAEATGSRVLTTFAAELPFPSAHPLYGGLIAVVSGAMLRGQFATADVIVAIGTPVLTLLFPLDESPFPPNAKIVHIDNDVRELGKNWKLDLGVLADPRLAMIDVLEALGRVQTGDQRTEAKKRAEQVAAAGDAIGAALDASARGKWDNMPMNAGRMMSEIAGAMDPATVLYDESITSGGFLGRYLKFDETGRHYRATGGGLGPGMPAPIGIKLARPDRPVMSIVGDGAALYTIQALWTQAREGLDAVTVIYNNRSYAILNLELNRVGAEPPGPRARAMLDLSGPDLDFVAIARGFGVAASRATSADDFAKQLERALAAPGPALIEAMVPSIV